MEKNKGIATLVVYAAGWCVCLCVCMRARYIVSAVVMVNVTSCQQTNLSYALKARDIARFGETESGREGGGATHVIEILSARPIFFKIKGPKHEENYMKWSSAP